MLKSELIKEVERLKSIIANRDEEILDGVRKVIDENCSRAIEPIESFLAYIELDYPTVEVTLEIPYGTDIANCELTDSDAENVEFDHIK